MLEQDLSGWEFDTVNRAHDFGDATIKIKIDLPSQDGIWFAAYGGVNNQQFFTWLPVEVAEAMGTMLLYSAQKWREDHNGTT